MEGIIDPFLFLIGRILLVDENELQKIDKFVKSGFLKIWWKMVITNPLCCNGSLLWY